MKTIIRFAMLMGIVLCISCSGGNGSSDDNSDDNVISDVSVKKISTSRGESVYLTYSNNVIVSAESVDTGGTGSATVSFSPLSITYTKTKTSGSVIDKIYDVVTNAKGYITHYASIYTEDGNTETEKGDLIYDTEGHPIEIDIIYNDNETVKEYITWNNGDMVKDQTVDYDENGTTKDTETSIYEYGSKACKDNGVYFCDASEDITDNVPSLILLFSKMFGVNSKHVPTSRTETYVGMGSNRSEESTISTKLNSNKQIAAIYEYEDGNQNAPYTIKYGY
jgi:hypothetical protein